VVLGNSRNDVVEEVVKRAMTAVGRGEDAPQSHEFKGQQEGLELGILKSVHASAQDALLQEPLGSFDRLCELTVKLNAYNSIQTLVSASRSIYDLVITYELTVVAAYYDVDTVLASRMHSPNTHPPPLSPLARSTHHPAHTAPYRPSIRVHAPHTRALPLAPCLCETLSLAVRTRARDAPMRCLRRRPHVTSAASVAGPRGLPQGAPSLTYYYDVLLTSC
jgi:hypothetical protein